MSERLTRDQLEEFPFAARAAIRQTALSLYDENERLREALEWYADVKHWTQPTGWGSRIHDDDSEAIRDSGNRARVALVQPYGRKVPPVNAGFRAGWNAHEAGWTRAEVEHMALLSKHPAYLVEAVRGWDAAEREKRNL